MTSIPSTEKTGEKSNLFVILEAHGKQFFIIITGSVFFKKISYAPSDSKNFKCVCAFMCVYVHAHTCVCLRDETQV